MNWLRRILLNLLIYKLLKEGNLIKNEWEILQEQMLRLNR